MKKYNKLGWLFLLCVIMMTTGCSKDFLEEPVPTESVSETTIFGSRDGAEAFLSGIARLARIQFTATDSGGLYSLFFARSVKGNDLIQADNWYGFDYANANREPNYRRTVFSWEYPYFIIKQTNALINGVEASTAISEEDKKELIAQGKVLRAFYYFQLSLEFQLSYNYDPSLPAPPIYKELSLEGKPMTTMQEMYDFILSDLESAVQNLDESRIGKGYVNIDVANGVLAKVYQVMENWPAAQQAAHAAYGGDVAAALAPQLYQNGFVDMSNPEWMWAMPQTADQSNYYYAAPAVMTDHTDGGYYATYINDSFVQLFSPTDVRYTFENLDPATIGTWQEWTTSKFNFLFDADMVIMRTAEMILIEAEALYHSDPAAAHDLLYELQVNRDPNAVKSNNTGQALLDEIMVERRKELYGEMGVEWYDAKRLGTAIDRDPVHRIPLILVPHDKRFFLKVPQAEIDANDQIDDSVNANR